MTTNEVFKKYTTDQTWNKIVDYKNVSEMWISCVNSYGDKDAVCDGQTYTYSQIDKEVRAMRAYLHSAGIKAGDNVGMFIPNGISFVITFLAITTLGGVAVLLPPHLDEQTLFGCTHKFSLKYLVYSSLLEQKTQFTAQRNPAVKLLQDGLRSEEDIPAVDVDGQSPCAVLFTGGTTGRSKGALLSHKAVMLGTKNGCYGIKEIFNQRYLLVLPLTHVFGLIRNMLTCFYTGSCLYICKNNKDMFKDIAIFKPTTMVLVPALVELALNLSKQFGRNMFGQDLKTIICGASAVSPYLIRECDKIGITLLAGYGLTESANLVSGNPESLKKPESVGYIYGGMEYKIVDDELWLKGDNMMIGYVGEPEENQSSYQDGYFKTGDLVRMDEEGFLYITGRKKEIIVLSSGENISPAEIEIKFSSIDGISDCLVYEEEQNGKSFLTLEVLPRSAFLKANGITDTEGYLKQKINEVNLALPSFMRINKIVIRTSDFIRSPSMKIVRNQNGANKK